MLDDRGDGGMMTLKPLATPLASNILAGPRDAASGNNHLGTLGSVSLWTVGGHPSSCSSCLGGQRRAAMHPDELLHC